MAEIPFSQLYTYQERMKIREKIIKLFKDDLIEPNEISKQLDIPISYVISVTRPFTFGPKSKYKYEIISKTEAFQEFMEYINSGKLVVIKDWYKKLGFNNSVTFSGFMKKHNINFKLKTLANIYDDAQIQIMKNEYCEAKLSINEICEKYDIVSQSFYKLIGKKDGKMKSDKKRIRFDSAKKKIENGLDFSNSIYGRARDILKNKNIEFEILNNGSYPLFSLNCSSCDKKLKRKSESILSNVMLETENKFFCKKCYDIYLSNQYAAARPICEKKNTTGYIGVSIYSKKGKSLGYLSQIIYKKTFRNSRYFYDPLLNEKTLLDAVVHRDKIIIRNDLPHTRNLSNEELISNMERLGQYRDIDLIKKKLG